MKRKSISLLATMALMLCSCLQVSAAPINFPLSYGNSYTYTETGGAITSTLYLSLVTMK